MATVYDFETEKQRLEQKLNDEVQGIIDMIMDAVDCEAPVIIAIINLPPMEHKPGLMERIKGLFRRVKE